MYVNIALDRYFLENIIFDNFFKINKGELYYEKSKNIFDNLLSSCFVFPGGFC